MQRSSRVEQVEIDRWKTAAAIRCKTAEPYLRISDCAKRMMKVTLRQWTFTKCSDRAIFQGSAMSDDVVALAEKMHRTRLRFWSRELRRLPDMSFHWDCCGAPALSRTRFECGKVEAVFLSVKSCAHCGKEWIEIRDSDSDSFRYAPISFSLSEAIHRDNISEHRLVLLKKRMIEISLLVAS